MKDNISYFSVEGRTDIYCTNQAAKALLYSQGRFPVKECKLFSPMRPKANLRLDVVNHIFIPVLNLKQHADWFVHEIGKYVETDFVITIENDGFVVNAECWDDNFLNYDYIGAPWPAEFGNCNQVGNGGFTLWSKKLLTLLGSLKNEEIPFGEIEMYDHLICVYMYDMLRERGIKFAPTEVAINFSVENDIEGYNIQDMKSFGFHGKRTELTLNYLSLL